METIILKWLSAHLGVLFGGIFIIIITTIVVMIRVNHLLNTVKEFKEEFKEFKAYVENLNKRTKKMTSIMGQCASISTANKLWVQDDTRNGGQPPDKKSQCIMPYKGCPDIEYEDD